MLGQDSGLVYNSLFTSSQVMPSLMMSSIEDGHGGERRSHTNFGDDVTTTS